MPGTIFEQLLDSYDGIRKRSWIPSVLLEVSKYTDASLAAALTSLKNGLANVVKMQSQTPIALGDKTGQLTGLLEPAHAPAQGEVVGNVEPTIKVAGNINVTVQQVGKGFAINGTSLETFAATRNSQSNGYRLITAFATEENKEGEGDTEDGEEGPTNREKLQQVQPVELTESERFTLEEIFISQGYSKPDAKKRIDALESAINTPSTQSNFGKDLAALGWDKPEMSFEVRSQALRSAVLVISASSKAKRLKDADGNAVKILVGLTGEEKEALRIITVRGQTGEKGVFIGRRTSDMEIVGAFSDLQEHTLGNDNNGYGVTWGNVLSDYAAPLFNAYLDPDSDVGKTSEEDLTRAVRLSKSQESGGKSLGNDYRGKVLEDVVLVAVASIASDPASKKEFLNTLKKRLQDGAKIMMVDLDNLDTVLLSDTFEGIQNLQGDLNKLGLDSDNAREHALKDIVEQAIGQTEHLMKVLKLKPEMIKRVERPSLGSTQGEKSDVDIVLNDDVPDNVFDHVKLPNGEKIELAINDKGERVLRMNPKNLKALQNTTVVGSATLQSAYAPLPPPPAGASDAAMVRAQEERNKAMELHDRFFHDRPATGDQPAQPAALSNLSQADRKLCQDVLIEDQELRNQLENGTPEGPGGKPERKPGFGQFTKANQAQMTEWFSAQIAPDGKVDYPQTCNTGAAMEIYEKTLIEIRDSLKPGAEKPNDPRQAAVKIWQLRRMARAQGDPKYAAAIALNDAVLSCGTLDNELLVRTTPGDIGKDGNQGLGSVHGMLRHVAHSAFDRGGKDRKGATRVRVTLGGTKVLGDVPPKQKGQKSREAPSIFETVIRAKTVEGGGRKLQGESRVTWAGVQEMFEQQDVTIPRMAVEEEPEEESNGTSTEEKALGEALLNFVKKALLSA